MSYFYIGIFVAMGVGFLLNKLCTWKKFCEIWVILSSIVHEIEDVISMIEKEIPDDTANKNLRVIDGYCKRAVEALNYAKLFLRANHIKNGDKPKK